MYFTFYSQFLSINLVILEAYHLILKKEGAPLVGKEIQCQVNWEIVAKKPILLIPSFAILNSKPT